MHSLMCEPHPRGGEWIQAPESILEREQTGSLSGALAALGLNVFPSSFISRVFNLFMSILPCVICLACLEEQQDTN